ncbi:MAG: G5 domain-containing protein [Candidatus Saccharibacteria bacterium]|nr:G5 domain-containing protein [Candidatus Saccharibacteria bacterium]
MVSKAKIIAIALASAGILGTGTVATIQNNRTNINGSSYSEESKRETDLRKIEEPTVEIKTETKEVEIPFSTTTIQDNSKAKGTSYVKTEGQNGIKTETYEVTYTDGEVTDRRLVSSEVTKEPVNKVVAEGTYVKPAVNNCPNGTYKNSAGNTVCRPAQTNTGGATAQCRDGSYSYSQNRRGTCSHHGGVARWL